MMSGELVWLPISAYANLNYILSQICDFLKCFINSTGC
jgi:hypothetical protein